MHQISAPLKNKEWDFELPFRKIGRNLPLFFMLLRNDLKAKFRHSMLGVLWLFIPPVVILLIYVYMFSFVFKMRWPETNFTSRWGFGLVVYSGITIYTAFSDSVMGSLNLLTARTAMLKKVPFPYELFPVSLVCSNMIVSCIILWGLFIISLATGGGGSWTAVPYFPLIYLPFILLTAGTGWIVSALGVFFRDLGNLLGILLLFLFFGSPVLYSLKMVPESFLWCIKLNPLTPLIENIRHIFLQNTSPDFGGMVWAWISGIAVFQLGFAFFQRMRRRFADVV